MNKDSEEQTIDSNPADVPAGLFDRIITAINREMEMKKSRRILFSFLSLLVVSLVAVPLSWIMLVNQMQSSGVVYFIATAIGDLGSFAAFWKDFLLAILESLPVAGLVFFTVSLAVFVFTLRLFLYKKRLLFGYLRYQLN